MKTTTTLIAIFIIVFIAQMTVQGFDGRFVGLVSNSGVGRPTRGIAAGEYYRLITAAFMHGGIFHILMNSYALYFTGPRIEAALGRSRFLVVYALSALGGGVAGYLLRQPGEAGLGASGAVFGLFGASFVLAKRLRADTGPITGLLVINLVLGFVIPGIGWEAHLGGLATGAALTAAFTYAPKDRHLVVQSSATVLIVVLLVVATVLRTNALNV